MQVSTITNNIDENSNTTTKSHPYKNRSNKSAGVILIDPWSSNNIYDPSSYRVMVVQQRHSGAWGLPKGHLEKDEDLLVAAHRELLEETGIQLNSLSVEEDFIPLTVRNEIAQSNSNNHNNHLLIKKIHFFVYILMRRGSSLIHEQYDSKEISAVSWMNVHNWYVDDISNQQPPRFNRTLSDTSVNILMDICEKTRSFLKSKYCAHLHTSSDEHTINRCVNLF